MRQGSGVMALRREVRAKGGVRRLRREKTKKDVRVGEGNRLHT